MNKSEYNGDIIETPDFIKYNLMRDTNTGSVILQSQTYYEFLEGKFIKSAAMYSDALLKIVDEIISNAIDAIIKNSGSKLQIYVKDGWIMVHNDGGGYPIYLDGEKYSVEICLTSQYAGTNYNDNIESTTTGNFGIGSKLTVIYSKKFIVETADHKQNILYKQCYKRNLSTIEKPILSTSDRSYTTIKFLLDYDKICRVSKTEFSKKWLSEDNKKLLQKIILRRTYEAGVYLNLFHNTNIYFGNTSLNMNFNNFISMHCGKNIGFTKLCNQDANIKYTFYMAILFKTPKLCEKSYIPQGFEHISIINGVVTKELSNYVETLLKKVENYIKNHQEFKQYAFKEFKKKLPGEYFKKNITIITVGQYPRKYFSFKTQSKVSADFDIHSLRDFDKYKIPEDYLEKIWTAEKEILQYIARPVNNINPKAKIKLYEPATSNRATGLFIVEGLSAATLIRKIIEKSPHLSRKEYGIFSCGGVPMNALKNSTEHKLGFMMNKNLAENDTLQSLINVLGLKYDAPQRKPKYNYIIISTDEDEIGVGKICSLIICFFIIFFPDLVRSGFIKRFRTPVMRSEYRGIIYDFYSEEEYTKKNNEMGGMLKANYYKGLAVHTKEDIQDMAKNYNNNLISMEYDELTEYYNKVFFGENTGVRKQELLKDKVNYVIESKNIPISMHLRTSTVTEQLGNIYRMIPSVYDGMLPVQRKIFATIRNMNYKKIKVSALSGRTIEKMNYSYGDSSLEGAIMGMAEIYPGSNNAPLLLPISDSIGSQFGGSKDRGAARYTNIKRNIFMDLYYPLEDDYLLDLEFEEGEYYQPKFYLPIVPRVLLENYNQIGTGWSSTFVARKFSSVINYVRFSIKHYPNIHISELLGGAKILKNNKIIICEGKEICTGAYEIRENQVIVTQLPLGLWGKRFIKQNIDKPHIVKIFNESGDNLKIVIHMNIMPQNLKFERKKPYLEPLVEYLGLYRIFSPNLNFYMDKLVQFTLIGDVFKVWFEMRRKLYIERINKNITRHNALIILKEGILHFIKNNNGNLDGKKKDIRDKLLSETYVDYSSGINTYYKLNESKILQQQQCDDITLKQLIYENGTYDYIYNLPYKMTSEEKILKLELELENLKKKEFHSWQTVWFMELEKLEINYKKFIDKKWHYKLTLD